MHLQLGMQFHQFSAMLYVCREFKEFEVWSLPVDEMATDNKYVCNALNSHRVGSSGVSNATTLFGSIHSQIGKKP